MNEIKTSIKALARRLPAIVALGVLALASLFPAAALAEEIEWAGITVNYTGADISYSGADPASSDLILTYTNTAVVGTLTVSEDWPARYLVVGGGGAGGTVRTSDFGTRGQGGGGGAGGFLTGDTTFDNAQTYAVYVGAGGVPAADQTVAKPGGSGHGSAITNTATSAAVAYALGGGGGGAQSVGASGGSGGGGSAASGTAKYAGGAGTAGQGNAGGAGNNTRYAAGGGGAGAAAGNTTSSSGSDGGVGLQSDITGTAKYYAGGGGGGRAAGTTAQAGGVGGGGTGGLGTSGTFATSGEPATGGGGGGGGRYSVGGAGGSGIVVIRLLMPAIAPDVIVEQPYTGDELSAIDPAKPGSNWIVSGGQISAVNANTYNFTIVPKPGLKWKDTGDDDERDLTWTILPSVVPDSEVPSATNHVYNGEVQIGSVPTNSSYYTLSNEKQTAVGTYTVTATLNNPAGVTNCTWPDGTTDPIQFEFSITKRILVRPTAIPNLYYTGSAQNGIQDSSDVDFYDLGGVTSATATGDYIATATIGAAHSGNCEWAAGDPAAVGDTINIPWRIGGQPVPKPTAKSGLVYNGADQVGIETHGSESLYTIVSTHATDAGNYNAVATLNDAANYQWQGEAAGQAVIEIPWSIAPKPVAPVAFSGPTNFVYDTNDHFVVVTPADWLDYSRLASGATNATAVGEYQVRFVLNSGNYIWNTTPATADPIVLVWSISKAPVRPPTAVNRVYNGNIQYGIEHSEDRALYRQVGGSSGATGAGNYQVVFGLRDPANNCWTTGGSDDLTFNWSITQAPNSITVLKLPSWKAEEVPVLHHVTADAEWKGTGEPKIDYSSSETGPWVENQPTNIGIYYVRATVAETANWAAAERTTKFSIWSDPDRIFRDYVDLRVQGYRGTEPLTNFPLLVRISENRLRGFYYSRAGLTGEDMVFLDGVTESPLPYEVDTWNTAGESLVWVRVNVLTNGAPIRMYWTLREGAMPPGYTPEDVWSDYLGVWHFGEKIDVNNVSTPSGDATGNGNFAWPYSANPNATIGTMTSGTGNIGTGRNTTSANTSTAGCRLVVSNTPAFKFDGQVTISGWIRMAGGIPGAATLTAARVWPYSRRNTEDANKDQDFGAHIVRDGNAAYNFKGMKLFSGKSNGTANTIWSTQLSDGVWSYFGTAYNGNSALVGGGQMNDSAFETRSLSGSQFAFTDSGENLAFGNIPGTNSTYYSFAGMLDEYRLTKQVRSESWLQAEFDTVYDQAYCTNSLVVKDGLKVNYWTSYPAFAPLAMEAGDRPTVCYNGRLAEGWASTNYVNVYDSSTNSVYPTVYGSYRVIFALDESFTGYELLEPEKGFFNLTLNGKSPYTDISGGFGDSGRILLMNKHVVDGQDVVNHQGYSFNTRDRPASVDDNTFWDVVEYVDVPASVRLACPNLKGATESILWTKQHGAKLWHLINCRHGNTAGNALLFGQNYLSWSPASYSIDDREQQPATRATAGQIVMRNWVTGVGVPYDSSAAVYSPCYTDGIGTIYFDAANGWNNNIAGNYGLCVEICTNVLGDVTALLPPTDENITVVTVTTNDESGIEVVTTNFDYYAKADWKQVPFVAYKRDNTADFVPEDVPASGLNLAVVNGGTTTNFYRMVVNLEVRTPARFRIRRTSYDTAKGTDGNALILLDNILVSYPAMSADLRPLGFYDPDRRGKQTLGQEIALETPFPAQTDTDVFARAEPYFYVNPGVPGADSNNFVVAANMHYRWRYLRQRAEPAAEIAQLAPGFVNYYDDSLWRTVPLNPKNGYRSLDPLNLPAAAGDIEFWYDLTMNTPYYEYVDYSGLDYGVPFDERHTAVTNHMTASEMAGGSSILPSTGIDWFVRVREGKSDFERMQVVVSGVLAGEYEMDPIEDNMWRALVKIPVDTAGQVSFHFVGLNRQVRGTTVFAENKTYFCATELTTSLPGSGRLEEFDVASAVKDISVNVDNTTGYLEFKLSDRFLTWAASRAEYQNFNNWSDARRTDQKYCVASGTNGVDDVAMKTYNAAGEMSQWPLFEAGSTNWNETFYLRNYNDPSFPKETFYQDHVTPNAWDGHNLTFVSKNITRYYDSNQGDAYSGMAAKLQGRGEGYLDFLLADRPKGIETVSVSARIGQSISFDTMSYSIRSLFGDWSTMSPHQNYIFFAPVIMSDDVSANYIWTGSKMAAGAAVSVIAYYFPGVGCYEFRISRLSNSAHNDNNYVGAWPRYRLELYRWGNVNGKIEPTPLCHQDFNSNGNQYGTRLWGKMGGTGSFSTTTPSPDNPLFWGMFISVQNTSEGTLVIGGVSETLNNGTYKFGSLLPVYSDEGIINPDWNGPTSGTTGGFVQGYRGIAYRDNSASKLTSGAYGVTAKDCQARFVGMHHYVSPVPDTINYYVNNSSTTKTPPGPNAFRYFNADKNTRLHISDDTAPEAEWSYLDENSNLKWALPGLLQRYHPQKGTEKFLAAYRGLCMPDNISQDVVLMLRSASGGEWVEYGRKSVSGYGYTTVNFPIHVIGEWNTRITSGANNVELVVGEVTQNLWEAPDAANLRYSDDDFVYIQGVVCTNTTVKQQELLLQPSRGDPTKAMSMRSPILKGLGKVAITYAGATADSEIWVQMATNDVESSLLPLSTSVKEGPLDWITIGKYAGTSKPGYSGTLQPGQGSITHYLGLHNRRDLQRPLKGLFRVFVPTNLIAKARDKAYLSDNAADINFGNIYIRGMTVTDEPGISERCWRGWNMRTIGDEADSEHVMYLSDTTIPGEDGSGLVGALNNSLNNIDDDPEKARADYPSILSPTFQIKAGEGRDVGVGSVDFRARLYSNTGPVTPNGGKIWLYGSKSSVGGNWTPLGEYTIDSSVMKTYTWSTGDENYLAIKFVIADSSAKTTSAQYDRIVLDEITIREKVQPSVGFLYARPFRNYLFDPVEVADILSPSEQPIVGESWGVQAKVQLRQLADEIDIDRGFTVRLSYYTGDVWGYKRWRGEPEAVNNVALVPVGDPSNLVFRSVGTSEETVVPPAQEGGIVQYQVSVGFYDRGGTYREQTLEEYSDWSQPSWYYPIDKNVEAGGKTDKNFFSPYTILDAVSPGRAWINEFNFNDGTASANGGTKPTDNQFIELCIPSGIDMSGWKVRLTDLNYTQWVMAKLGANGLPGSKLSLTATNNFEFYLLESPATDRAGGINRRLVGAPAADGVWDTDGRTANAKDGTLVNEYPYQLELIRPNGIIEHQIVFEGTNTVAHRSYGYLYSATNLAYQLQQDEDPPAPKRMVVGSDVARAVSDPTAYGSSGVVGGDASGNPAPGDEETWVSGLKFTPGWLNEGQIIPYNWFVSPNGTNCWVYFVNNGAHIVQQLGTNTAPYIVAVIPKDTTTNISYTVAKWYAMDIAENEATVAEGVRGSYIHSVTPTTTTFRVVATEKLNPALASDFGLDDSNPYSGSVLNWLTKNWPGSDAEDIRAARFQGLQDTSKIAPLSLTEMYWLDIPPVPESPAEASSPDGGSNWWLRAGITKAPQQHLIYRLRGGKTVCFTNQVVDMQMYLTNTYTGIAYAPKRLQGLDDARSDNWSGVWTSETFKVRAKLNLGWDTEFLPFRFFIFNSGSFTGPDGGSSANFPEMGPIGPYSARIEVLDPHSAESIGVNYGWDKYPNTSGFYLWSIDTEAYPFGVQTLKADDTYPANP